MIIHFHVCHFMFILGGVALEENFSTAHCSPHCGTPFQVQGVYRETVLRRDRDYEEGRFVALITFE